MSLPISSLLNSLASIQTIQTGTTASSTGFKDVLATAINNAEASGANADKAAQGYLSGANQELHSTILASQSAELDFQLLMQVRNKVVSAYEEIMRMQV